MSPLPKGIALFTNKNHKQSGLDKIINDLETQIQGSTVSLDEYSKQLDQLAKLYKMKESVSSNPISKDTLVLVAGNLTGIALILGFERANIVTSKALSFVMKLR